jgi:hypothetical protein
MNRATTPIQSWSAICERLRLAVLSPLLASAILVGLACSKNDESSGTTPATPAAAPSSSETPSGVTAVRGRLVSVTDSVLTVSSRNGDARVEITPPLEVYSRVPAEISQVKENSFIGVTSVPQPDGSLRATEIHIFPEKLRGMNEGSFLMGQQGGGGAGGAVSGANRMTNGTVTGSTMTNGTVAGGRMTNGTVGVQSGGALAIKFHADSQKITVPSDVTVTAITLTQTSLAPGMNVVIPAKKQPDGTLKSSTVMLSPAPRPTK